MFPLQTNLSKIPNKLRYLSWVNGLSASVSTSTSSSASASANSVESEKQREATALTKKYVKVNKKYPNACTSIQIIQKCENYVHT